MLVGHGARGFSLPELLVSLTIGLLLLAAFLAALARCRQEFATNESLASLQDGARRAMSVLVADLEHSGFYGNANAARFQLVRRGAPLSEGEGLQQPDETHAATPVNGLPSGAHDCGDNFALDLALAVQASNDAYAFGAGARDCAPTASAGGAGAKSDTLTVRHASLGKNAARAGRLQLYSRRLFAHGVAQLFADGDAPGPVDADADIRDVEIHAYYVSNASVGRSGWPALRVKTLTEAGGAMQFRDEEIQPGVEDLQVEFGVRDPLDAQSRLSFVPPDYPGMRSKRVVAVRLWLRIRADHTESGYFDARPLRYAGVVFVPGAVEARQRRLLLMRTVALRNPPVP